MINVFLKKAFSLIIGVYTHLSSFWVSFFTGRLLIDGTYIPSILESISKISFLDLFLFSLHKLTKFKLISSPSPITKKSKKSL